MCCAAAGTAVMMTNVKTSDLRAIDIVTLLRAWTVEAIPIPMSVESGRKAHQPRASHRIRSRHGSLIRQLGRFARGAASRGAHVLRGLARSACPVGDVYQAPPASGCTGCLAG